MGNAKFVEDVRITIRAISYDNIGLLDIANDLVKQGDGEDCRIAPLTGDSVKSALNVLLHVEVHVVQRWLKGHDDKAIGHFPCFRLRT